MTADPWQEFQAMTPDECMMALSYLAGRDPEAFARVLELSRGERERRRGVAEAVRERAKELTAEAEAVGGFVKVEGGRFLPLTG